MGCEEACGVNLEDDVLCGDGCGGRCGGACGDGLECVWVAFHAAYACGVLLCGVLCCYTVMTAVVSVLVCFCTPLMVGAV